MGHAYDEKSNKMVLYFENGGAREIKKWNGCELKLGQDWVLAQKKHLEAKTGQDIKLAVKE